MRNIVPEIIDEINRRKEEALDNDNQKGYEALQNLYNWIVDNYID